MIRLTLLIVLASLLTQCGQKEETVSEPELQSDALTTERPLTFGFEDPEVISPDEPDPPELPAEFSESEPKITFAPQTEEAISSFLEAHPGLDTINELVGSKPFRELKEAHLPNWQPDAVMKERIIESFRMAAAAQGVDPESIGGGDPKKNPKISINIAPDPEGLRRVMGYLYEGNSLNYSAELLRQLDAAVMQSMADPDSAQIRVESKN